MNDCADYFDEIEWKAFQAHMEKLIPAMRGIAQKNNATFFQGCQWPEIGIKKGRFFGKYILRIGLNDNYLTDKDVFYQLKYFQLIPSGLFSSRAKDYRVIRTFSVEDLNDIDFFESLLLKTIEAGK